MALRLSHGSGVKCLTWVGGVPHLGDVSHLDGHHPAPLGLSSILGASPWGGGEGLPALSVVCDSSVKQRMGLPRLMSAGSLGMEITAALGDSQGPREGTYSPQEALELALLDWVAEINQQALEPGRL